MDKDLLKLWLTAVANREMSPEEAMEKLAGFPYQDLGFAKVDSQRCLRNGYAEVIYCPGKEPKHVVEIFQVLAKKSQNIMATRANYKLYLKVKDKLPEVQYFEKAKIIVLWRNVTKTSGKIGIISAGTADQKVAEEAAITAEILGSDVNRIYDVGVAGIHRLFDQQEVINNCRVLVVVAGMGGALASVVGGLVDKPIIAVPTSIGYGANFKGLAPLLSMLNSCASGIAVVNIDNGFGAGVVAHRINLLGEKMSIAHLDCNAGISGNMFVGALMDLGFPLEILKEEIRKLPLTIPEFQLQKVLKKGITATWFDANLAPEHHHRNLSQIIDIIIKAGYSKSVTDNAIKCFRNLAEAEAKIHGVSTEEVHFHEVGATDAIIDIVGACLGIEFFQIKQMTVSPIRMGFGTVKCAHGEIPVPAPAALELVKNLTIFSGEYEGEWTTPTGAAILKSFANAPDSMFKINLESIGYGAGTADRQIPNVLRIILGKPYQVEQKDYQIILETNIDDLNPELYGFLGESLLKNGARDFYFTSIYMKKGRPGILVTAIVPPENVPKIEDLLFKETSTLGVRKYLVERHCLEREYQTVDLRGCKIKIKTALRNGEIIKFAPEYNDCLQAAQILNRPLKDIYDEANFQYRKMFYQEGSY